jgi:hypothetical protein
MGKRQDSLPPVAKKKKKRPPASGVDPNERRRQRLEARRQAKAEALKAQQRAQLRERILRYVLIAGLVVIAFWFFFLRGQVPDAIAGHEVEHFSISGANDHTETDVAYDTNPPLSGAHSQRAVGCGVYSDPIQDENQVHTLEHGAVGLLYQPTLEESQIEIIEGIVQERDSHVFSAPDDDMKTPVAVTAWGNMMKLEEVDRAAIAEFIDFFAENADAPEGSQPCPTSEDSSFLDRPSPSPIPTASPTETSQGTGKKGKGG